MISTVISTHRNVPLKFTIPSVDHRTRTEATPHHPPLPCIHARLTEGPIPPAPGVYAVRDSHMSCRHLLVSVTVRRTAWCGPRRSTASCGSHRSNASPTTHSTRCRRTHLFLYRRGDGHHRTPFRADGRYHPDLEKFYVQTDDINPIRRVEPYAGWCADVILTTQICTYLRGLTEYLKFKPFNRVSDLPAISTCLYDTTPRTARPSVS